MDQYTRKEALMEKLKVLTAIMEPGGLTLEDRFDMMLTGSYRSSFLNMKKLLLLGLVALGVATSCTPTEIA